MHLPAPSSLLRALCALTGLLLCACASWVDNLAAARNVEFNDVSPRAAQADLARLAPPPDLHPAPASATAFREVEVLDQNAWSWANVYASLAGDGILVFDANDDGRPDLYFPQNGQNWTRPTDASGILKDTWREQPNMLYLNQGNREDGSPIFVPVQELVKANDRLVREELLIEDYLFPREKASDDPHRFGRASMVAAAADFNGDGRPDLLVGNCPEGMLTSHLASQNVVPAFIDPVGRAAKPFKITAPPFGTAIMAYKPTLSLDAVRQSARGSEPEGANSLYLNLGDQDGDGIPEWQDISREAGIEGFRPSASLAIADFDGDGDLDVYVANFMDEDFWVPSSRYLAGGANTLYLNQLAETGVLRFEEKAAEWNCDGVYDEGNPRQPYYRLRRIPLLPLAFSLLWMKLEPFHPDWYTIDGKESEHAEISWACVAQDVNADGYPDLWVANDFGWLRLYLNDQGRGFVPGNHARSGPTGFYMSFAPADFNRDGHEDLFVGNVGGVTRNPAVINARPADLFTPTMNDATVLAERLGGFHDSTHALLDGANPQRELGDTVYPSSVLPPDALLTPVVRFFKGRDGQTDRFRLASLDPYEFAWGSVAVDVQNDGWTDLYWVGGLNGRPGSVLSMMGINPGRLLVNHGGSVSNVVFSDQTAEHHLFNIEELRYDRLADEGYVYRKAPRQNWSKRDVVYSFDRSAWSAQGPLIQTGAMSQDLMQTVENGRGVMAADLNLDGYPDLIVRNKGGYDSRSSSAKNLQIRVDGTVRALPSHDNHFPTPTNYEPGRTRVFLNQAQGNNWLRIKLVDEEGFNRDAIGARVLVNGDNLQVMRAGEGSFASNRLLPLQFGLGTNTATHIRVVWPGPDPSVSDIALDGEANSLITLSRQKGRVQ